MPGEFAEGDLTLAPFQIIEADGGIQIGKLGIAAALTARKQILEQGHDAFSVVPPCLQYAALQRDV